MSGPSTLRQVAERAGVSISTASQALNNKPNVAPQTRARVMEAAALLGYQQQIRIPSSSIHRLETVGMITRTTPDLPMPVNWFYSYVLAGVERECRRAFLKLMYATVEVDTRNAPANWPLLFDENSVDGLLIVGSLLTAPLPDRRPIVLVDAYAPGQSFDSIVTENFNGAYRAVSYLIDQGHEHIGLIGSSEDPYPSIAERRAGYLRALKDRGIRQTYVEYGELVRESGYETTRRLLARAPQMTAIFACNDNVAFGVLNAAHDMGIDVPRDLSVIGFDDVDLAAEIKPALTTVRVDKVLMGTLAVRLLMDRAEDMQRASITTSLSTELVIRSTVQPPKGGDGATRK